MTKSTTGLSTLRDLLTVAFTMQEFPERKKLPTKISSGVGQLIARFSYIEFLLAKITYELLGISTERGRLSIQKFRAEQYIPLIKNLIKLRGGAITVNLDGLQKELEKAKEIRDLFAHGVWLRHPSKNIKTVYILVTTGSWKPPGAQEDVRRSIKPEARSVTADDLRRHQLKMDEVVSRIERLQSDLFPSSKTSRKKRL